MPIAAAEGRRDPDVGPMDGKPCQRRRFDLRDVQAERCVALRGSRQEQQARGIGLIRWHELAPLDQETRRSAYGPGVQAL